MESSHICLYCQHLPSLETEYGIVAAAGRLLTPREKQVWLLLGLGLTNRRIALTLVITEATVKKHVATVMRKLSASSRLHASIMARTWHQISCTHQSPAPSCGGTGVRARAEASGS
ncbi:hypothetical protein GCM10009716_36960 [Streptomyces sodiiphilus]|uniref:HTH luxR-type domain-containing protein n=1 Tax=Streptomyces sodiiphilus TaxID=226217 RepID=A0ABP5B187_9ACTN